MTTLVEQIAETIKKATDEAPYCVGRLNDDYIVTNSKYKGSHDGAKNECERLNGLWIAQKVVECIVAWY